MHFVAVASQVAWAKTAVTVLGVIFLAATVISVFLYLGTRGSSRIMEVAFLWLLTLALTMIAQGLWGKWEAPSAHRDHHLEQTLTQTYHVSKVRVLLADRSSSGVLAHYTKPNGQRCRGTVKVINAHDTITSEFCGGLWDGIATGMSAVLERLGI